MDTYLYVSTAPCLYSLNHSLERKNSRWARDSELLIWVRTWTDTSRAVWRDVPTANDENGFFRGCSLGQRFVCAIWRLLLRRMGSEYSIHPLIQPCRFGSPPQSRVLPRFIDQQNFHPARCPLFGYDHKCHCCLSFIIYLTNCKFSGWNLWIQRALFELDLIFIFFIFRTVGDILIDFSTHRTMTSPCVRNSSMHLRNNFFRIIPRC